MLCFIGCYIGEVFYVFFVVFFQYYVFGIYVIEQCDGVDCSLFQIVECDDVVEGFSGVENVVGV